MNLEKSRHNTGHIRQLDHFSRWASLRKRTAMRRTRHDHLHGKLPCQCRSQIGRCPAIPVHPKAALASRLATTSSAYNGTSAQRQPQAIGAARRDPRRGEIPMCGARRRPVDRPSVREVVSNRTGQTTETAWAVPGNRGGPAMTFA